MTKLRKHYRGCYRFDLDDYAFGQVTRQVTRQGGMERGKVRWFAEIRQCRTGDLIKACWLWDTRRDAIQEILAVNPLDYLDHSIGR